MINEQNQGISRRSFIKRSTVAAIAATIMMMFTGLVNAADDGYSILDGFACNFVTEPITDMYEFKIGLECYFVKEEDECGSLQTWCYSLKKDVFGNQVYQNGLPVYISKSVHCLTNDSKSKSVICDTKNNPTQNGAGVIEN